MILRGSTPRTLSPVGWMALLTFGALLLPLTPIRGQDQPVPEGAKPKLEGPPNEGTAPDISAAKAALERAAREVERQRAELEEAERRLKKAMAAFEPRQARPEGAARAKEFALSKKEFVPDHVLDVLKKGGQVTLRRGPEGDLLYQIDQEKPDRAGDGGRHRMPGMPGGQPGSMMPGMPGMAGMGMPGMPGMPMPGTGMPGMDTGGMRPGMPGMAGMSGMMGKGPGGAGNRSPVQRLNALEKQVKALLAEMESLRHELHPEKPH